MSNIPFQLVNWASIDKTVHKGETGSSISQTIQFGGICMRMLEYSANYSADHWCQKGHIAYCLDGECSISLGSDKTEQLYKGMSFIVSDQQSSHCLATVKGAKLLIIDGDFLH